MLIPFISEYYDFHGLDRTLLLLLFIFNKIMVFRRVTRLRDSPGHGGSGVGFRIFHLIRRGGVPSGAAGCIINLISRYQSPLVSPCIYDFHGSGPKTLFIQVSHKKLLYFTTITRPQDLSGALRVWRLISDFWLLIRPRGVPSVATTLILKQKLKKTNISALFLPQYPCKW